ncbi:MAG TPA: hypothetical protein ENI62_03705 [Gammaproteobacteria bacterium]|nr:hypothetical protein [Gammaproteobacteria bacterium]
MTDKNGSKVNSSGEQHDPAKKAGDREQRQSRRRSLRALLAGSGIIAGAGATLPKWQKPVIDSIILPSHAQTSTKLPAATTVTPPD